MSALWRSVLCFCCLWGYVNGDDLDLFSRMYLSDKKYAKNIEVQTYLVTKDQVAEVFGSTSVEIVQKANYELYGKEVFLLVRCKNKGEYMSFGILNCTISNRGVPISVDIAFLPGNMHDFHDCVIYVSRGLFPNDDKLPNIKSEWKSLYTM
jgi:hypothetical protein